MKAWRSTFVIVLVLQVASALFFVYELLTTIYGIGAPLSWQWHEFIELLAVLGLLLGIVTGALVLRAAISRSSAAESRLRTAQAAFLDVVDEQFGAWGLTPAERDVAMFAVKGMTTAEIAELRQTSQGTVKAQSAAIYRKAGVANRAQLMSLFIDHLMQDVPEPVGASDGQAEPSPEPEPRATREPQLE